MRDSHDAAPLAVLLTALASASCTSAEPPAAPPPPEVRIVVIEPRALANVIEIPARLQAVRTAEVRAQVDGIVERRLYEEGTDVAVGQPLFSIDPRQLRAGMNGARATLERALATESNAAQDVKRYEGLVVRQAISQQEYDAAVARARTAKADVAQARAQVEAARLDLDNATIEAPIAGRAGRAEVTEGALVSAASATPLTRIDQLDPIYANFSQSTAELLAIGRQIASGELAIPALREVEASLVLEDGSVYPTKGKLNFRDLSVDEQTGTSAMRAQFPNPKRVLLPGQFVRIRIEAGVRANGVLIPQRAVTLAPQGASVMVVGAGEIAEARPVKVGDLRGSSWVVLEGLAAGDRVIVDGLQGVRAGSPVRALAGSAREETSPSPASDSRAAP